MLVPSFASLVEKSPILPVLHMESVDDALKVTKAIYDGGISAVEIVLRSPVALDCIEAISSELPQVTVGVGTLTNKQQILDSVNLGAKFLVSPSFTTTLAKSMIDTGLPMLPGVVTPSEITQAIELGLTELKFFPAEQYGGINTIKALSSVFNNVKFCPTGGIGPHNMADYFGLSSIFAVGGSWMADKKLVAQKDWPQISNLTAQALQLINRLEQST